MIKLGSAQIKDEILSKFGFFPPFFEPALGNPRVLENLWRKTLEDYIENPLPDLFKEKLAALLARYCTVPYCLMCHSSSLSPKGMQASEVLELLEMPALTYLEISEKTKNLNISPLKSWPISGSPIEESILYCCVSIFLNNDGDECHKKLRALLGEDDYNWLIIFICYNKTALAWAESHPELSYEADYRAQTYLGPLLNQEPKLKDFFQNYRSRVSKQQQGRERWLTEENKAFLESEKKLRTSLEGALDLVGIEKENLLSFIEQTPAAICVLEGPEHRYLLTNKLYKPLVGNREIDGKVVREALPELEGQGIYELLDKVYSTGEPFYGNEIGVNLIQANGETELKYLNFVYQPWKKKDGTVKGILVVATDVSEQVSARTQIEKLRHELDVERINFENLFEKSSGFVTVIKGKDLVYSYSNPTHDRIVGGQLVGQRVIDTVPDTDAAGVIGLLTDVFNSGKTKIFHELPLKIDHQTRYFDANYVARRDETGTVDGVMAWGRDVTEQVIARKQLEVAVENLTSEKEIREKFVATLTHDLRTPMTSARLSAQLLAMKSEDPSAVKILSSRVVGSIDHADRMIRDLLDANRIKAGEGLPIELDLCNLDDIVKRALVDLESLHGPRFHFSNLDEKLEGIWDGDALQRVIENLASNAVKYGSSTGPIDIALTKASSGVRISIHNEGNPIPASEQESLFNPYKRTNSAFSSKQKGWGIGLTLVRGLVEAHNGKVWIESSETSGTTFTVELPINSGEQQ